MSLNTKKCTFSIPYGLLLGYVVSLKGLMPDINKVSKILQLKPPTTVTELHWFLGHVGFYRRFIQHYVDKEIPLTKLLQKQFDFDWDNLCHNAFLDLKALIEAPIFGHILAKLDPVTKVYFRQDSFDDTQVR